MSWKPEVDGIEERRRLAKELGGAAGVERQHALGRLTIRERIAAFADADSFREQGPIAGHSELDENGALRSFTPANYVLGLARVDGRPVVLGGEDFTQRGGSPTPAGLRKSVYAEELAVEYQLPLVRFLQGGGGSVVGAQGGKGPRPPGDAVYATHRFLSIARAMQTAPVVSAALGAVAGFPAARLVASHLAVMTRESAQVMVAGPAVVERAMGETLSKDELGGGAVHGRNGVVDLVVEDEVAAFAAMRRFLGYLPSNVHALPPLAACEDPPDRTEEALLDAIPQERRKVYAMRKIVAAVVDRDSFFELGRGYGRSQITGLARLGGRPVGVWANDPHFYAGAMSARGARKVRRFVDLCDAFHLPVVAFVDEPGFMLGARAEADATIRFGTEAMFAVVQSTVPWASVIVRKTYGVAAAAHFGPGAFVLAWPSSEGGALPLEGGVAVAFRREIEAAEDPDALRHEIEERLAAARSAFPRAESFGVHDLIDPRTTRPRLCEWLAWVQPRLEQHVGVRTHALRP
ncbi:MAG: propionyl-CoA carboxylase [Deltaproteobacteria bacterium]|nr:propionyl-CoA carboxylase [Deltaproteobacteria bacterium]MBW2362571.1 propionyl-CoA carboxylase [Deltaproteobacteria bacterium]